MHPGEILREEFMIPLGLADNAGNIARVAPTAMESVRDTAALWARVLG